MASRLQLTGSQFTNNYSNQAVDQWQTKATYKLDSENKLLAGLGFTKVNDRRANRNHQHDDWSGVGLQGDYTNVAVKSTSLGGLWPDPGPCGFTAVLQLLLRRLRQPARAGDQGRDGQGHADQRLRADEPG